MKVSVVTVTYNSAATIGSTLQSMLRQTYPDIEYWIIDGASTDATMQIVKEYDPRFDGRLHYISEPDNGIYEAINKGIRHATGDVVGILNSDDFFTSDDVIECMVKAFSPEVDAVYGDVHYVRPSSPDRCIRYYSSKLYRPSLAQYGFMPHHASFYCRRSLFDKLGYYKEDYKISADFELVNRYICQGHIRTHYLHKDFVTMRTGGVSTRGLSSIIAGTEEDLRACKELGISTNRIKMYLGKYLIKLYSMLMIRS